METDYPNRKPDFNKVLQNKDWLDVASFPKITFTSTKVELVGPNSARVTGDLEMHGVKKEIVLDAVFNGGYASHPMDPMGSRIGFSARGVLKRSDFGVSYGVPQAGSSMGVGDVVEVVLEVEFVREM